MTSVTCVVVLALTPETPQNPLLSPPDRAIASLLHTRSPTIIHLINALFVPSFRCCNLVYRSNSLSQYTCPAANTKWHVIVLASEPAMTKNMGIIPSRQRTLMQVRRGSSLSLSIFFNSRLKKWLSYRSKLFDAAQV